MKRGFTASAFDLGPHAGHLAMLEEAKRHCDFLIVGLHVNPNGERDQKNKPLPSVSERCLNLVACKFVDQIIPYETEEELVNLIQLLQPDVRFLGEGYKDKEFTGKNLGIPIHYCSRKHQASSSGLRARVVAAEKAKSGL